MEWAARTPGRCLLREVLSTRPAAHRPRSGPHRLIRRECVNRRLHRSPSRSTPISGARTGEHLPRYGRCVVGRPNAANRCRSNRYRVPGSRRWRQPPAVLAFRRCRPRGAMLHNRIGHDGNTAAGIGRDDRPFSISVTECGRPRKPWCVTAADRLTRMAEAHRSA